MRIALFSAQAYDREYFDLYNTSGLHPITYFETALHRDTANLASEHDVVCVFVNDRIDKPTIDKLAAFGIRLIALRCAGFNNVDLVAAHAAGLRVVRVPAYSPHAVAEHAVALLLTLNRKTHKAYSRVRESNFSLDKLTGFDLYRKVVGVVGTGQIGKVFCEIMLGFGCIVKAYDVYPDKSLIDKGVQYVTFDELLSDSDILSLHCPLNNATYHLFSAAAFDKMKPGAMLINTSRGALIHTADAIEALKHKQLGYLGIDVYEQEADLFFKDLSESIIPDELIGRLMAFPNVIITAHQGFFTKEALSEIAITTLQNIQDAADGKVLQNEVVS